MAHLNASAEFHTRILSVCSHMHETRRASRCLATCGNDAWQHLHSAKPASGECSRVILFSAHTSVDRATHLIKSRHVVALQALLQIRLLHAGGSYCTHNGILTVHWVEALCIVVTPVYAQHPVLTMRSIAFAGSSASLTLTLTTKALLSWSD